jgi:hypothetical protein
MTVLEIRRRVRRGHGAWPFSTIRKLVKQWLEMG